MANAFATHIGNGWGMANDDRGLNVRVRVDGDEVVNVLTTHGTWDTIAREVRAELDSKFPGAQQFKVVDVVRVNFVSGEGPTRDNWAITRVAEHVNKDTRPDLTGQTRTIDGRRYLLTLDE